MAEYVLYIMVRPLKLNRGKLCSQVSHAGINSYVNSDKRNTWMRTGSRTIILYSETQNEYIFAKQTITNNNLQIYPVIDAGLTFVKPNTQTCFSVEILDRNRYYDILFKRYSLLN